MSVLIFCYSLPKKCVSCPQEGLCISMLFVQTAQKGFTKLSALSASPDGMEAGISWELCIPTIFWQHLPVVRSVSSISKIPKVRFQLMINKAKVCVSLLPSLPPSFFFSLCVQYKKAEFMSLYLNLQSMKAYSQTKANVTVSDYVFFFN